MGLEESNIFKELGINIKSEDRKIDKKVYKKGSEAKSIKSMDLLAKQMGLLNSWEKIEEFTEEFSKDKIKEQYGIDAEVGMRNHKNFIRDTYEILASIDNGYRLKRSYLIGAPNCSGKREFISTAIRKMISKSMEAVPYISLSELGEIRVENERRTMQGLGIVKKEADWKFRYEEGVDKKPEVITGRFSWSEYMNCSILFTFFSSIDSKVVESLTLRGILESRASKGLPTVVMMASSLKPYTTGELEKIVWREILADSSARDSFNTLKHTSCFLAY